MHVLKELALTASCDRLGEYRIHRIDFDVREVGIFLPGGNQNLRLWN